MRRLLACLLLAAAVMAGCGGGDVEREVEEARSQIEEARKDIERRVDRSRRRFRERREQYGRRIEQILDDLRPVFERPRTTDPVVRSRGNDKPTTIDAFLTALLEDIDGYWEETFRANDLPVPQVRYNWIPPGQAAPTSCGNVARDSAALYCPADDTIYVGQRFAANLNDGVSQGLPGERAGYGRAAGDFAVAYVLAHEYAHNLQQELGVFDNRVSPTAKPYELQADCMAGTWAHSVYAKGELDPGDLEEATTAALAVGDFDVGTEQHHGTPPERRDALLAGFRSGDPSACRRYLPA